MANKNITKPIVKDISQNIDKVTLDLFVDENLRCFKGHFDDAPVTPGIVQLDWAINFANEHLEIKGNVKSVEVLKFQNLLLPKTSVQLELIKKSDQKFTFSYSNADESFSSGRVVLED